MLHVGAAVETVVQYLAIKLMLSMVTKTPTLRITTTLKFSGHNVLSNCLFQSLLSHLVLGYCLRGTDVASVLFALLTSSGHTDDRLDCFRFSIVKIENIELGIQEMDD